MKNISKNISYNEAVYSATAKRKGIDNTPNESQLNNMKLLAEMVFEPIRINMATPIYVSSMFRSEALNKAIGGAKSSQHLANNGAAMDLDADVYGVVTNEQIFEFAKDNLTFDQLIWEFGDNVNPNWVHISYKAKGNRGQILIAYKDAEGKTKYTEYSKKVLDNIYKK